MNLPVNAFFGQGYAAHRNLAPRAVPKGFPGYGRTEWLRGWDDSARNAAVCGERPVRASELTVGMVFRRRGHHVVRAVVLPDAAHESVRFTVEAKRTGASRKTYAKPTTVFWVVGPFPASEPPPP